MKVWTVYVVSERYLGFPRIKDNPDLHHKTFSNPDEAVRHSQELIKALHGIIISPENQVKIIVSDLILDEPKTKSANKE